MRLVDKQGWPYVKRIGRPIQNFVRACTMTPASQLIEAVIAAPWDIDAPSIPDEPEFEVRPGFRKELEGLLNRYSKENESNTPDFILADFMVDAMIAFDDSTNRREKWYGRGDGSDNDTPVEEPFG